MGYLLKNSKKSFFLFFPYKFALYAIGVISKLIIELCYYVPFYFNGIFSNIRLYLATFIVENLKISAYNFFRCFFSLTIINK